MKNRTRLIILLILLVLFIPLTYIKATTAGIQVKYDTTFSIVKTDKYFRLNNFYIYDIEKPGFDNDTWYFNKNYKVLNADEFTGKHSYIYKLLIFSWWSIRIILIVQIRKLIKALKLVSNDTPSSGKFSFSEKWKLNNKNHKVSINQTFIDKKTNHNFL